MNIQIKIRSTEKEFEKEVVTNLSVLRNFFTICLADGSTIWSVRRNCKMASNLKVLTKNSYYTSFYISGSENVIQAMLVPTATPGVDKRWLTSESNVGGCGKIIKKNVKLQIHSFRQNIHTPKGCLFFCLKMKSCLALL